MPPSPPSPRAAEASSKSRRRIAIGSGILAALVVFYCLSLYGFHKLTTSSGPIQAPNLNPSDDTIVLIRLEQLDTVEERLTVKVLVIPQEDMVNQRLHVLTTDTAVRMEPPNDLGDLVYPAGKSPAQVATTIEARGDNNNWPFDSYITDTLSAQALVGGGDGRYYKPTRVEVTGALEGWDVTVRHVGGPGQEPWEKDNAIITLHRARAPLMFDLGICLVLFSLPALAFAVVLSDVVAQERIRGTVRHVVRCDAVRGDPHPQLPARRATPRRVDRPRSGDLGAGRAGCGDGCVHDLVVPAI